MHPALAHDLVGQHMRQRLDEAAASRLGRQRRDRRNRRRVRAAASAEPKLRVIPAVAPQAGC